MIIHVANKYFFTCHDGVGPPRAREFALAAALAARCVLSPERELDRLQPGRCRHTPPIRRVHHADACKNANPHRLDHPDQGAGRPVVGGGGDDARGGGGGGEMRYRMDDTNLLRPHELTLLIAEATRRAFQLWLPLLVEGVGVLPIGVVPLLVRLGEQVDVELILLAARQYWRGGMSVYIHAGKIGCAKWGVKMGWGVGWGVGGGGGN
jgi:hypothetical protein